MPFATTWIHLGGIMLNEVKFDREDKITSDFSHMWNQKKQKQMNIRKWKQVQRYREKTWFP